VPIQHIRVLALNQQLLNTESKRLGEVMKLVYWSRTCRLSANVGSKHNLQQLKEIVFFPAYQGEFEIDQDLR